MRTVPIRVDGIVIEPVLHHDRAGLRASVSAETAAMLAALPVPQGLRDRVIVVKFGGNAMVDDELQRAFADDMVHLASLGVRPVVVHGGGPQISAMLERLGIESEFRGGYRVTSEAAIDVVRMVLTGTITRSIVSRINVHGPVAAGVSGEDAGLFTARRRGTIVDGVEVDLGFVGDVVKVDPSLVLSLLDSGRIPVVSSIASDGDAPGASLNVNADAAAAALAIALGAEKLVILTDVPGLYRDWPDTASLVTTITAADVRALLPRLESGMIPKMTACVDAVEGGVRAASVVDGRVPHSAVREIVLERSTGTVVVA